MAHWQPYYLPPQAKAWQGRQDSETNEYFFQCVHCHDLSQSELPTAVANDFILIGFACDEGVRRNFGRSGASEGPDAIRQQLATLCTRRDDFNLHDLGNVICPEQHLESAQLALAHLVNQVMARGYRPIVLGGGHEVAWGHYQGIRRAHTDPFAIINFDAHTDLRAAKDSTHSTSGTSFWQIAQDRIPNDQNFDYCCVGLQDYAYSRTLDATAQQLKVTTVGAHDIHCEGLGFAMKELHQFVSQHQAIYLSFCLDVISSAHAPGVSAPQSFGLTPQQILPLFRSVIASHKVISFDIAELAPRLDIDGRTAKLAATLVADYIHQSA